MVKRRTKEELLAEFHRLYSVLTTIMECQFPYWPQNQVDMFKNSVATRSDMLRMIEEGKANTSQIVEGTRQAVNDCVEELVDLMEYDPETATKIFAAYTERTGRDFWNDAGNPVKAARAIVKRGKFENETEYYLLNGLMSNVDQNLFTGKLRDKAYEMIDDYNVK